MASFLDRLKQRKLVQWCLAYAAGAWFLLEATGFVSDRFAWPEIIVRALTLLAGVGFFVTLILAWYHGEKGRQRVSGPELLMLAALFVIAGGVLAFLGSPDSDRPISGMAEAPLPVTEDPRPSVAVLPFVNRSGDEEDRYFTDGMHDELLTRLSQISGLKVLSRGAVEEYRETTKSNLEIGRELGVGYLLEGGVQRMGDRLRVNVQLIDASNEGHVWAETLDRESTSADLFDIQSEITLSVARQLRAAISAEERERLARRSTDNLEAYEFYLRSWDARGDGSLSLTVREATAERLLKEAIRLDPDFALAHAALGEVEAVIYQMSDPSAERAQAAKTAVDRALALDPALPAVHFSLGYYYYRVERDYTRALESFDLAETTGLRNFNLAFQRGHVLRRTGRWQDAIHSYEQANELNPRGEQVLLDLGLTLTRMRRYDEAETWLDRALQLEPDFPEAKVLRARVPLYRDGDTGPLRELLAEREDPGYEPYWRWRVEFLDRDWGSALTVIDRAEATGADLFPERGGVGTLDGWTYAAWHDSVSARDSFTAAASKLDGVLESGGRLEHRYRSALGVAYAGLGRHEEAIREAELALRLIPPERDAIDGPESLWALCLVHAMLDEAEATLDCLDEYLLLPGYESIATVNLDPRFDPLRDHPRFQALLERYATQD